MILKPLQMTKQLRTGIDLIDRQHEEFFQRANRLIEKCDKDLALDEDEIHRTLDFVWLYVIEHFSSEEDLMNIYDYPDRDKHVRAHMEFRKQFLDYREHLMNIGIKKNTMRDLLFFMRDWFFKQIVTHDMKLAAFLKLEEAKANSGLKAKLLEMMAKFFPVR